MARYREKLIAPIITEDVEWTGDNLDEVEDFLGTYFERVDSDGRLWFRPYDRYDYVDWVSSGYMIYVDELGNFAYDTKEGFLDDWDLMEE